MEQNQIAIEDLFDEAVSLRDAGRAEKAIEKLAAILEIPSARRAPILGMMGHIYFKEGKLEKALNCAREAVALSPRSELGSLLLFHTLWDLGKESEAFAEAKRFLGLRDSEEYFLLIEEMRDAFLDAGIDLSGYTRTD